MKKLFLTILSIIIIASPSILVLDTKEGIELYGPDYYETLDYFTGPSAKQ